MESLEIIAVIVVMLLALYGCACAIKETVRFMVKPRKSRLRLELILDDKVEGVEQQVRYAVAIVHHFGWPLYIIDQGMTDEQRRIVDCMYTWMDESSVDL